MSFFVSLDRMIEKDFETGLAHLESIMKRQPIAERQ